MLLSFTFKKLLSFALIEPIVLLSLRLIKLEALVTSLKNSSPLKAAESGDAAAAFDAATSLRIAEEGADVLRSGILLLQLELLLTRLPLAPHPSSLKSSTEIEGVRG